jgi:hypothetical protein
VTTKSIARITTQPLARYGKPRFTHSKRPVPRVHQIVSAVFQLGFVDLFCREYHLDGTVQALTIAKD